jgi:hypothetical protein
MVMTTFWYKFRLSGKWVTIMDGGNSASQRQTANGGGDDINEIKWVGCQAPTAQEQVVDGWDFGLPGANNGLGATGNGNMIRSSGSVVSEQWQ